MRAVGYQSSPLTSMTAWEMHTDAHIGEVARLIAPQGRFGYIDDLTSLDPAKRKRARRRRAHPRSRRVEAQAATRPPSTSSTWAWARASSMPLTAATSRVSRSSAAS